MPKFCYYNGAIILIAQAKIPMTDIGVLRGYAIFDFGKLYRGKPFLLQEHIERFKRSAKKMKLAIPVSDKQIHKIIHDLAVKNKMADRDANVRFVLTGGTTVNGLEFDPKHSTFFILMEESKSLPAELYTRGAKLITHEHQRIFADIKTTNYLTAVRLQEKKNKAHATEILLTYKGKVLECTTSNFFMFKDNTLITPKDNILIGITRNFVIKLARKAGFKVIERDITMKELGQATEAFITASNKEILPIVKVDNQKIGNGNVGPNTKKLIGLFQNYIIRNLIVER